MSNKNIRKLSTILLFLGVVAWIPFIFLVIRGQAPSIYPFLAVHLTGVIGGSRLRARAKEASTKRPRRQVIGRVLIILGVLAWAPYFYQHSVLQRSVQIDPYLTVHLTGVLGGLALLLSVPLARLWRESRRDGSLEEAASS